MSDQANGIVTHEISIGGNRAEIRHTREMASLFDALAKAQASFQHADRASLNPDLGKSYADIASVLDTCRAALAANGLAVLQPPTNKGPQVTVTTILGHSSGQWIACDIEVKAANAGAHAIGSAITYGRRYSLSALLGIAPATPDDDGEAAEGRGTPANSAEQARPPSGHEPTAKDVDDLIGAFNTASTTADLTKLRHRFCRLSADPRVSAGDKSKINAANAAAVDRITGSRQQGQEG